MPPTNLPYIVYGTITDVDSTFPNGAKVVIRNDTNGETLTTYTNSSGQYIVDLANLASGYTLTDRISVICAFGNADKESSFLVSADTHLVNLTLVTVSESADLTYCQVQDVLDELGDKTTSDISFNRVRKIILRSEDEIEDRVESTFKPTLVTDEVYDFDQYTSWKSPDNIRGYRTDILVGNRNDYWNTYFNDRIKLERLPIINPFTQLNGATTASATDITVDSTSSFPDSSTIFIYNSTNGTEQITYTAKTSTQFTGCTRAANSTTATAHADNSYITMIRVSKNSQGKSNADSWVDLQPQVGGGGDFILQKETGIITFVNNSPTQGIRKAKTSYTYGFVSVPRTVERLCILLSVRDVLLSKGHSSQFDTIDNISLEGISISKGIGNSVTYFKWLNEEIDRLWTVVGEMVVKTA